MRPLVLITGASSGIGYELALEFARHGYDVVAVARNAENLQNLADTLTADFGVSCHTLSLNLAEPDAPAKLYNEMKSRSLTIDVLVNNAGFGTSGKFAATDLATELEMMQLNIVTVVHLTKLFLRGMQERGRGRILNVASTAGFQPGPLLAIYYASKAFALSFSEALATELEGSGLCASVLCPGPTRTRFQERADLKSMPLLSALFVRDPEFVARKAYRGLQKGKRIIIPGLLNKFGVFIVRLLPRKLVASIVAGLHKRRLA